MKTHALVVCIVASSLLSALPAAAAPSPQDLSGEQEGLVDRGFAAKQSGDLEGAVQLMRQALELGEHPSIRLYLGELALDLGDCDGGREHLHKARHNHFALPGKDVVENRRRRGLHRLHSSCPATVVLTCGDEVRARIGERAVTCGEAMVLPAGEYVIEATVEGRAALPRRIQAQGAEVTTLRLDPPGPAHPLAHWTPTSEQPIPEQDPRSVGRGQEQFMSIFLTSSGAIITGLSITLLVVAYTGRDPHEDPDPAWSMEELEDEEELYNARVAFGWGFSVAGAIVTAVGVLLWPGFEEPSDTPGFSLAPGLQLAPILGEALGGGLRYEF